MTYGVASYGEAPYGAVPAGDGANLAEGLVLTDTVGVLTAERKTVTDAFVSVDTVLYDFTTPLYDALAFNDATAWDLVFLFREIVTFRETLTQDSTYNILFEDGVAFTDVVRGALAEMLSEALVLTDTASYVRYWGARLRESLLLGDSAAAGTAYNWLLADVLALADVASHGARETLTDALTMLDAVAGRAQVYKQLVDSISAGDTSTYLAAMPVNFQESLVFTDTGTAASLYQALLADDLQFLLWDGNNRAAYSGYVMNPKVGGLTEYQNYNFNSIAKIGASYYGASNTGLYLLEGADDAGTDISVRIKFGAFNPGSGKKSRVEQAYIGVRTDGKLIFKTFADDGKERWYETQAVQGDLQTQRAKLGRGVKSRYWQFELMNRDGEPMDLEQFEFLPITLTRRV